MGHILLSFSIFYMPISQTCSFTFWIFQIFGAYHMVCVWVAQSHPTLWCHGLEPTRLLCPWDYPGQEYWTGLPFPTPGDLPHPFRDQICVSYVSCIGRRVLYCLSHQGSPRHMPHSRHQQTFHFQRMVIHASILFLIVRRRLIFRPHVHIFKRWETAHFQNHDNIQASMSGGWVLTASPFISFFVL